ncbi:MAG: LAGLIDADG family homing endonuclease [Patescibacteria group bacterium]
MKISGDYIAGFIDGEGCFTITISKHRSKKLRLDARIHFQIEVRDDDREILQYIQETIDCGKIYTIDYSKYGWHPHVELKVSSLKDITEKLIPFFEKYPLRAKKRFSYQKFLQAVEIFKRKEHLTQEGIEKLRNIRQKMNVYSPSSVGQGTGKPCARSGEKNIPAMGILSQNTANKNRAWQL